MTMFTFKSLEQLLKTCFITSALIILILWVTIGLTLYWSGLNIGLSSFAVAVALFLFFSAIYKRALVAFKRASMHLEAVSNKD